MGKVKLQMQMTIRWQTVLNYIPKEDWHFFLSRYLQEDGATLYNNKKQESYFYS